MTIFKGISLKRRDIKRTQIKERAFNIIKNLPDDKVVFVVRILEGLEGLCISQEDEKSVSQRAYHDLQKYRKEGLVCHRFLVMEEMETAGKSGCSFPLNY